MAQLDARPTSDQGVAGSISAGSGNILSWRLIMNIFNCHSVPSADSRRAFFSFWRKNVHKHWLTAQRTKPYKKCVIR